MDPDKSVWMCRLIRTHAGRKCTRMFHAPDYYHGVSLRLSEVLNDIGVSERRVMRRRRASLLLETIITITCRLSGNQLSKYLLGSQSEGTTIAGLQSDSDNLICQNDNIVIQDWAEWAAGKYNLLMIQDDTSPPGYCYLQLLRSDVPLPATDAPLPVTNEKHYAKDTHGRVLMKNTIIEAYLREGQQRQGPSAAEQGEHGLTDTDKVLAIPFKSWPQSARHWLDEDHSTWPTAEMKRYAATTECFVVATGSSVSEHKDFQWRISTSLAERCLMFNLSITQIRCYILLKMILKTFINIHGQKDITSYMCKTVLLHCIRSKPTYVSKESNILNCLTYCLSTLNKCILCGTCPHFVIPGNNLMAGKITAENKQRLLEQMSNLIQHTAGCLLGIQIDGLGQRLFLKLDIIHDVDYNTVFSLANTVRHIEHAAENVINIAFCIGESCKFNLLSLKSRSLEAQMLYVLHNVSHLARYYIEGNRFVQTACRLLAPMFCTTLGSLMASHNIQHNNPVSPQALGWLSAGIILDVSSGRLKLASVFYCTGDVERAAFILRDTEERFNIHVVQEECYCYEKQQYRKIGFLIMSTHYNDEALRYIIAFCVGFMPSEYNCIPKELQYEMFRSTAEELLHGRNKKDAWMDSAVVDSLPYLYFLQYKTYGSLQRRRNQQKALNILLWVTENKINLKHRETAWNLAGQCMEQENRLDDALQCYWKSLQNRQTNNVARVHICTLLARVHICTLLARIIAREH